MRLLHIVGIVFAIIGISAAVNLFSATTDSELASAQDDRSTSAKVSTAFLCNALPQHISQF